MSDIRTLASRIPFWIQVTRLDRPVGWIVLLWPTWIALTLAGFKADSFDLGIWVIFTLGVVITRSAGCVVNDLTDRQFDKHVKRTRYRPITTGNLSVKEAVILAIALLLVAFALVLLTNAETIMLSVIALILAIIYPWLKRITFWPQIGLGLAFSMAIPMAFAAYDQPLDRSSGRCSWVTSPGHWPTTRSMRWLTATTIFCIGVKSTAIMFGRYDLLAVGCSSSRRWSHSATRSGLPNSIRWSLLGSSEQLDLRSISNALHALGPVMPASEPLLRATALGRHYFLVRC